MKSVFTVLLPSVLLLSPFTVVSSTLAAPTVPSSLIQASPKPSATNIKQVMKQMKLAYRAADRSTSLTEFAKHTARLKQHCNVALKMSFDGSSAEQSIYQNGVQKLVQQFVEIDSAIASGNLSQAKLALKALKLTEKTYHAKLKV